MPKDVSLDMQIHFVGGSGDFTLKLSVNLEEGDTLTIKHEGATAEAVIRAAAEEFSQALAERNYQISAETIGAAIEFAIVNGEATPREHYLN